MADINALKSTYFLPNVTTHGASKVTALVDGSAFGLELEGEIMRLGRGANPAANAGQFILIASWWLGLVDRTTPQGAVPGYGFGPPNSINRLLPILLEKARAGVDLRVLGWVSPALTDSILAQMSGGSSYADINQHTLQSIKALRAEPAIGGRAILNILAHPAGAAHAKVVVLGDSTSVVAFTGGIDLAPGRYAGPDHYQMELWHDVVAKVEGEAVQSVYDWFREFWEESLDPTRKPLSPTVDGEEVLSVLPNTPALPARVLPTAVRNDPAPRHHVQSLRTIPQFLYASSLPFLPRAKPLSFAPAGAFTLASGLRKALTGAQRLIYLEDQAFWSREQLSWVNAAVKAHPRLRVILLMPGGRDPNDPDVDEHPLLCESINRGLLDGIQNDVARLAQIRVFRRYGDTLPDPDFGRSLTIANVVVQGVTSRVTFSERITLPINSTAIPPNVLNKQPRNMRAATSGGSVADFLIVGNDDVTTGGQLTITVQNAPGPATPANNATASFLLTKGITVHSKTAIVDDHWALIGSANVTRRSLFTDIEHAVAVLDEDDLFVKEYRKALWAEHFRHPAPADFDDLDAALHAWDSTWGVAGSAPPLPTRAADDPGPPYLEAVSLPLSPDVPLQGWDRTFRNRYKDVDSRMPWRPGTPWEPSVSLDEVPF
jgi:phosphatidylserine/phosphatidylglycerophosphate/cardiolipin synthase-like enzyme